MIEERWKEKTRLGQRREERKGGKEGRREEVKGRKGDRSGKGGEKKRMERKGRIEERD